MPVLDWSRQTAAHAGVRLARTARLAALVMATATLGGCFDLGYTVNFKKDGTAGADIALKFDREVEDVFGFIEAIGELRPEGALFLRGGLCPALELAAAFVPQMPMAVKAKQGVVNNRFACEFNLDGPMQAEQLFKILETAPISKTGILSVKSEGPRRWRVTLNMGAIPDGLPQLAEEMVKDAAKKTPNPGFRASPEAMQRLIRAIPAGMVSFTKMGLRDGTMEFAISAARVVETNGKAEGNVVRFNWKWTELVSLMLSAEARRGKTYYAVVEF